MKTYSIDDPQNDQKAIDAIKKALKEKDLESEVSFTLNRDIHTTSFYYEFTDPDITDDTKALILNTMGAAGKPYHYEVFTFEGSEYFGKKP